jgi:UDP-N-acetylmuramoyl-tripeptide--D-alanyl-D-alanine ligase
MSPNRMNVRTTAGGVVLIDDCYNANPKSMAAALDTLAALPARRRTAFVGVMAELKDPDIAHRLIAAMARQLNINLVAVDTNLYGDDSIALPSATLQSAILQAREFGDGDAVLVKGSRVAGLERLVHAFG